MKKTLIALIALAGVAMGGTLQNAQFDDGYSMFLAKSGYQYGQTADWSLSFTIDAVNTARGQFTEPILTLDSAYFLVVQVPGNVDNAYVGLAPKSNEVAGWTPPADGAEGGETSEGVRTWTLDAMYADVPNSWLSYSTTDAHASLPLAGTTITLSSSSVATNLQIGFSNGTTSIIEFTNTQMLDANNVTLSDYITQVSNATLMVNGVTYLIPEPATATLSLMALAGLAARRRRK